VDDVYLASRVIDLGQDFTPVETPDDVEPRGFTMPDSGFVQQRRVKPTWLAVPSVDECPAPRWPTEAPRFVTD
jgi:hypothetical protein